VLVKDEAVPGVELEKIGFEFLDGPITPKPEKLPGARKRSTSRRPKPGPGGPKGSSKGPLVKV
jgi:ATP-dependent Clp protease ATP-binding subunit ClpA